MSSSVQEATGLGWPEVPGSGSSAPRRGLGLGLGWPALAPVEGPIDTASGLPANAGETAAPAGPERTAAPRGAEGPPADGGADAPGDAPADVPPDAPADGSADTPAATGAGVVVMAAIVDVADSDAGPRPPVPAGRLGPTIGADAEAAPAPPVQAYRATAPLPHGSTVATAEELSVMEDVSRETEDTPIARAAETAVRVLAGRTGKPLPRPPHLRVLTVANQKGGVGKTTTTVNVAAALALQGANVLVVDLDPQGNASTALGIDHHSEVPSVYDVLVDGRPLHEVVRPVDGIAGLWCAPATIDLAGAEIELVSLVARESRLDKALTAYAAWCDEQEASGLPRLDYVLIDCPPSLGLLTVNALVAAPEVLIPIQCEYYALEGVGQLLKNIELVKAHLNPGLHVSTVLLTMYDARTRLAAQVADEVRTHFATTVLRTTIPRSVRISEAPSYGQTVMTYDPGSTGALSYLEAAREMAIRGAVKPDVRAEETS
jgi:chromosome partitioning protein